MSPLNFAALAVIPATTASTRASSFREYVCPVTASARAEPERVGDPDIQLADLVVIAVKQLEITALRARRALDAAERKRGHAVVQIGEIEDEILHPQRRALAHGRQLCRLQMRVAERRLRAPLAGRTRPAAAAPARYDGEGSRARSGAGSGPRCP